MLRRKRCVVVMAGKRCRNPGVMVSTEGTRWCMWCHRSRQWEWSDTVLRAGLRAIDKLVAQEEADGDAMRKELDSLVRLLHHLDDWPLQDHSKCGPDSGPHDQMEGP